MKSKGLAKNGKWVGAWKCYNEDGTPDRNLSGVYDDNGNKVR